MATVKLPEKLHNLLEVAMGDFEQIEASDAYEIDMGNWHVPEYDDSGEVAVCSVCFAGAVMAGTLGIPDFLEVKPDLFPEWNRIRLQALDALRCGQIRNAYRDIHDLGYWDDVPDHVPEDMNDADFPSYEEDPVAWKTKMQEMIAILRERDI